MAALTKVALVGATGNLGPVILDHLLEAGLIVTVLTREGSSHKYPPGVFAVKHVDYDSIDSLTSALEGQEVVVSTIAIQPLEKQLLLINAAGKAGVKRFIPSEFGPDDTNPKAAKIPTFIPKVVIQKALKEKAAGPGGLTYSLIMTGAWFDWGIRFGFIIDVKNKHAELVDGGNRIFSASTLETVGKAVVGVIKHPAETENRAVYVHDAIITLREVYNMAKNVTGPDGWRETIVSEEELLLKAYAELQRGEPDRPFKFVKATIWGEGYGSLFSKVDNELFGIQQLSQEQLQAVVARAITTQPI